MIRITLLVIAVAFAWNTAGAKERVYTWTDKDGSVHFSDKPLGPQATPLVVSPPPGNSMTTGATAEPGEKKPAASDDEPVFVGNPDEDPKVRAKNCEQSRNFVKAINDSAGRRLYVNKEDGSRHWLSEEERAQKIEAGEKAIKKWCD